MISTLYRAWDDQQRLLYVGLTYEPVARFADHAKSAEWMYYTSTIALQRYDDRTEAEVAEAVAILTENPVFNKTGRPTALSRRLRHEYLSEQQPQATSGQQVHASASLSLVPSGVTEGQQPVLFRYDLFRSAMRQRGFKTEASRADAIGVSKTTLHRWRHGESVPDITAIHRAAGLTGIPVDELFSTPDQNEAA